MAGKGNKVYLYFLWALGSFGGDCENILTDDMLIWVISFTWGFESQFLRTTEKDFIYFLIFTFYSGNLSK